MYEGRGMYKAVLENVPEIEARGNTDTFKRHMYIFVRGCQSEYSKDMQRDQQTKKIIL